MRTHSEGVCPVILEAEQMNLAKGSSKRTVTRFTRFFSYMLIRNSKSCHFVDKSKKRNNKLKNNKIDKMECKKLHNQHYAT